MNINPNITFSLKIKIVIKRICSIFRTLQFDNRSKITSNVLWFLKTTKMKFVVRHFAGLLLLTQLWESSALQCYKCEPAKDAEDSCRLKDAISNTVDEKGKGCAMVSLSSKFRLVECLKVELTRAIFFKRHSSCSRWFSQAVHLPRRPGDRLQGLS